MREGCDDVFDRRLSRKLDRGFGKAEPLGPQPHLCDGFFAGDVDGALTVAGIGGSDFDQQGRFPDARVAAQQQHRAADEPAASDAVELGDARGEPRRFQRLSLQRLDDEQAALA